MNDNNIDDIEDVDEEDVHNDSVANGDLNDSKIILSLFKIEVCDSEQ